ncbi:MAG: NAD(P)H-dependent oxidoreductase [Candidatus Kapabacteria bacterium]|nr:NAD(P)H-dependent oxidoreductase [Candidatus Kapabacteria bacterium]
MNILAISGSLRQRSINTGLLRSAESLLPEGTVFTVADLRTIPFFDADLETTGIPESVLLLKQQIMEADGVLIASPEYNFSYTGVLKNAIDWASRGPVRPFLDKPVAVIGASPGNFGTVRAQTDLRRLMHGLGAHVLPKPELLVNQAASKFDFFSLMRTPSRCIELSSIIS